MNMNVSALIIGFLLEKKKGKKKSNFGYFVDFFSKIYWIDLQRFLVKTETLKRKLKKKRKKGRPRVE